MNRYIPTLCLAGLLLACSHENKGESRAQRAERGESAGEERAERRAEQGAHHARNDAERERVELKRRGHPGRMASGADTLPVRDADNTEVNDRDRDSANLTPMDQGNDERDLELTQSIRKSVVGDDSLSFGAKNVKIITREGHVTLRGPVNSAAEKEAIYKTAVTHAGVGHVTNELEVDDD